MSQKLPIPCLALSMLAVSMLAVSAAPIDWSRATATSDGDAINTGTLLEAANFGNSGAAAVSVNGVPFDAVDFSAGGSPSRLVGLSYNTGETEHLPGAGLNTLYDSLAYRSGADPQVAELTGLTVGMQYLVQFFYYHRSVDRSVTISDGSGNDITLDDLGEPTFATGIFTADAPTQPVSFDASSGSQFLNAYQLRELSEVPPMWLGEVVISEFVASNRDGLQDGDGNSPDWIEIWNSTDASVDLAGWFLTDDVATPALWPFPAMTLAPGEYLIVFASGQPATDYVDAGGGLHTNFALDRDGGYLALSRPDGAGGLETADVYDGYPRQEEDTSYGLYGSSVPPPSGYLARPTPGQSNSAQGFEGFVGDTAFSLDRGFYDAPILVAITTTGAADALVRYTTDGSEPTLANGLDYPGAPGILVSGTTVIRAAGFKEGFKPTNIDTHTYLFADDIVDQPADPAGFPTTWTGADYGMEQVASDLALVAGDPGLSASAAKEVIADSLKQLPAMSLAMHVDDWFSPATGIYHNSTARGAAWERACSAELIFPPELAGDPLQIDCGVRVQGNTSRSPEATPKHSLRLAFRGEYGEAKLRYPFFGDDAPAEFDTIVLRSNSQDGWVYSSTRNRMGQFVRDAWARETHRRMGHASPDSNWVHLFINGLYWGVYNPTERPDSAHGAAYYGGDKDDWDAIKNHEEVLDGNISAYRDLLALIQNDPNNWNAGYRDLSDPADYAAVSAAIDVEMLIDYMIHNMYAAADDWPGNFYMGYDRSGASGGWRFFDWDNEHGMKNPVSLNRTTPHSRDDDSPTKFHHALKSNADYRQLFADRLHLAFSPGGVLHVDADHPQWDPANPQRNVPAALWMELTGEIETALIAESARWGDYRKSPPYTVANEFTTLRSDLLQNWFPQRSAIVLGQFRAQGLYPQTTAPEFAQAGGLVASGFELEMSSPGAGTIYYTLDGSDPRPPVTAGEEVVLLGAGAAVRAMVPASATQPPPGWQELIGYDDSSWQAGVTGVGYETFPADYEALIGLPIAGMRGANESVYIRVGFELADEAALAAVGSLRLDMRYDDGFIAYLNGVQVAAANAAEGAAWNAGATASHSDTLAVDYAPFDISSHLVELQVGQNVLAIHGLNSGVSSSDFLIDPRLVASSSSAVVISPSATAYASAFELTATARVRARTLGSGGEWSPLTEATFVVGTGASAANLAISEIMYHPAGGAAHEFIELVNLSPTETIELTGVRFVSGITFEFPSGSTLGAGGRLLLVEDALAFAAEYGSDLPVAGQYTGKLDNGGERLLLLAADGSVIQDFTYGDAAPWPVSADGGGYSLVSITNDTPADPSAWRSSITIGGNAGAVDSSEFSGDPSSDTDADGIGALLEYAFGSSDTEADRSGLPRIRIIRVLGSEDVLELTYLRNLAADDLIFTVEQSGDLLNWYPDNTMACSSVTLGDGRAWFVCRRAISTSGATKQHLRLRVSLR